MAYDKPTLTVAPTSRVLAPAFLLVAAATLFAFLSIGVALPVPPRYTEPPAGRLGDLRGRRPLMIGGALMVVGAAGLVAAEHIAPVVGLRLLTGIGEALFLVGG